MLEQFVSFIAENDPSSALGIVGRSLVAFFSFLYKVWFAILIKISILFANESYVTKAVIAVVSVIVAAYSIFYIIKKIIASSFKLIGISILRILKGIFYKPSKGIRTPTFKDNAPEGRSE
ncbi:MAG TPA: hypothetical protein VNK03_04025 [Gammaproteobacteria bacterium]|jgi:hypothetical protein|nr:hypothetical protein [Gammaproteobacteria bacterium]